MMKVKLIAFGIARDILGGKSVEIAFPGPHTVQGLLDTLNDRYPDFDKLASLKVAVNTEYASPSQEIHPTDEIVLIPPVSGG